MSRRGFTLLELLLVVVVLAILASMVFGLMSFVERTRFDATETALTGVGFEVRKHQGKTGFPPGALSELAPALPGSSWIKDGTFVDAWDRALEYKVEGRQFRLWSCGPDGISGSADDLVYGKK